MNSTTQKIASGASAALLLAGMGAAAAQGAVSAPAFADEATVPTADQQQAEAAPCRVCQKAVQGLFTFSQSSLTPTAQLRDNFARASRYLCGGEGAPMASIENPGLWEVAVSGNVDNAFSATMDELAEEGSAQLVMGCTCAGNPVDGAASGNADVLGVRIAYIAALAQPSDSVNTIVFTSDDGSSVALPFNYVLQRFSLLAYSVNGEPVGNSMGGSNQLWMGSTAANYYLKNVVEISFEERQTPPPTPGTAEAGDAYENVPNISIGEGGAL